jgi:hypothetical protein
VASHRVCLTSSRDRHSEQACTTHYPSSGVMHHQENRAVWMEMLWQLRNRLMHPVAQTRREQGVQCLDLFQKFFKGECRQPGHPLFTLDIRVFSRVLGQKLHRFLHTIFSLKHFGSVIVCEVLHKSLKYLPHHTFRIVTVDPLVIGKDRHMHWNYAVQGV